MTKMMTPIAMSIRPSTSGFAPVSNRPQMSAARAVASPPGRSARPVSVGVNPRIVWVNSGKMNTPPYSPKPSAMKRKIEPASCRFLSTRKLTTGCGLRGVSSHQSMVDKHTADRIASRVIVPSSNQS